MTSRGKVIVVANPKGGVGKSTVTSLIAATLKWSKKLESIHVVDADQQASTLRLLRRIEPSISCSHYPISYEYDKLNVILLEQLMNNCRMQTGNILIIDTPARPDQEGVELLTKSHAIIIPCSNTMAELPITLDFVKKIDDLKARLRRIHPHIVIIPNKIHLNRKHICKPIKNNISIEEFKIKYGINKSKPKVNIESTKSKHFKDFSYSELYSKIEEN